MARVRQTKAERVLKRARAAKNGIVPSTLVAQVGTSSTYVRDVLRDAGFAPTGKLRKGSPVWA